MTLLKFLLLVGSGMFLYACESAENFKQTRQASESSSLGVSNMSQAFLEKDLGYDFACSEDIEENCDPSGVSLSDASCVFVEGSSTYFPIIRCALTGTYGDEAFSENRQYRWAILPDDIVHGYYWAAQKVDTAKATSEPFDPRVPYPRPLKITN